MSLGRLKLGNSEIKSAFSFSSFKIFLGKNNINKLSISKSQREINKAFNAEGNFDELNNQITRLAELEESKRLEAQLSQMSSLSTTQTSSLPVLQRKKEERTVTDRETMILNLSDIQAALQEYVSNGLDQDQEQEHNRNNLDTETTETQKELNKAFSQK